MKPMRKLALVFIICSAISGISCQGSRESEAVVSKANPNTHRLLGNFRIVEGTSYLMAPISSGNKGEYSSSSSSRSDSNLGPHNYVFFNTADESTRLLLPTNDFLIAATSNFPEKREGEKEVSNTRWFLYGVVKADTNGDENLSHLDRRALAVSDAGGVGYTELITDVEQVFGQALRDENTLIVIYRKGSKNYVSVVDLPNRTLTSTKELPALGADVK